MDSSESEDSSEKESKSEIADYLIPSKVSFKEPSASSETKSKCSNSVAMPACRRSSKFESSYYSIDKIAPEDTSETTIRSTELEPSPNPTPDENDSVYRARQESIAPKGEAMSIAETAEITLPDNQTVKTESVLNMDFHQLYAPDELTEIRSGDTPIGNMKTMTSDERLCIVKTYPKSYSSGSEIGSNFVPPTIQMENPALQGTNPVETTCQFCFKVIKTDVESLVSKKTYCVCLLFFVLLLWPLMVLPFCMRSCKEPVHRCPNCGSVLSHPDTPQHITTAK